MRGIRNTVVFFTLLVLSLIVICLMWFNKNEIAYATSLCIKQFVPLMINEPTVIFEEYTNKPHEYPDEVDLRIIIIVGDRAKSLQKQLAHLEQLEMDGDSVRLHIWIDRNEKGYYDQETLNVARRFQWKFGIVQVHVQAKHVGIYGQWINTWRPKPGTKELGVIFEDDVDMSPYFYRWAKAAFIRYSNMSLAGIALREIMVISGPKRGQLMNFGNDNHTAYLYKGICTQGYLPDPHFWRDFQDWFYVIKKQPGFRPYVEDTIVTSWYRKFEREKRTHTMWEMWFFYFASICRRLTLFPNLAKYTGQNMELSIHRAEKGLHFNGGHRDGQRNLLNVWRTDFIKFPKNISMVDFNGNIMSSYTVT